MTKTEEISISLDDLTIGQVEQIEGITGESVSNLDDPKAPKGKLLKAIVFVLMSANDPAFTLEDAGQVKISALSGSVNGIGDDAKNV